MHRHRFIIVLAIACTVTGCEEKLKPSITGNVGRDMPAQESWDATITFTDSGRTMAVLKAGHIAMFEEKKFTLLDSGITVDFFDQDARHTSVLRAQRGKVYDHTRDFEAWDHVTVLSDSGTMLRTEKLYWTNSTQKVHTPDYVEITSPTEAIYGHGLESDQSLKHYKIMKVTGRAKPNE